MKTNLRCCPFNFFFISSFTIGGETLVENALTQYGDYWQPKVSKWPPKDNKWPAKDNKWPAKDNKWPAKDRKWHPQENGQDYSLLSALSSLLHHAPHHPPPPPPNWTPKPVTSWRKRQKKWGVEVESGDATWTMFFCLHGYNLLLAVQVEWCNDQNVICGNKLTFNIKFSQCINPDPKVINFWFHLKRQHLVKRWEQCMLAWVWQGR